MPASVAQYRVARLGRILQWQELARATLTLCRERIRPGFVRFRSDEQVCQAAHPSSAVMGRMASLRLANAERHRRPCKVHHIMVGVVWPEIALHERHPNW